VQITPIRQKQTDYEEAAHRFGGEAGQDFYLLQSGHRQTKPSPILEDPNIPDFWS
jgi:hypothetical protein